MMRTLSRFALSQQRTRFCSLLPTQRWTASCTAIPLSLVSSRVVVATTTSFTVSGAGAAATRDATITTSPCRYYSSTRTVQQAVRRRRRKGMDFAETPGSALSQPQVKVTVDDNGVTSFSAVGKGGQVMAEHHSDAVTDPQQFQAAATALMEQLYHALEPLRRFNDHFILTRGVHRSSGLTHEDDDSVDFIPGEFIMIDLGVQGQYNIQIDLEKKVLQCMSPISGKNIYVLSRTTGEWIGFTDGHLFRGMIVRDLIRQCNGVPRL